MTGEDDECANCDGVRVDVDDGGHTKVPPGRILVERCDTCQKFEDDVAAARSVFADVIGVTCSMGSVHALADPSSRIDSYEI